MVTIKGGITFRRDGIIEHKNKEIKGKDVANLLSVKIDLPFKAKGWKSENKELDKMVKEK